MDRSINKAPLRTGAAFSLELDRDLVHVYGEPAFHYFLDIERARFIRSARPCVLLRVDLKDQHGIPARLPQTLSERLFLAIAKSVREIDKRLKTCFRRLFPGGFQARFEFRDRSRANVHISILTDLSGIY